MKLRTFFAGAGVMLVGLVLGSRVDKKYSNKLLDAITKKIERNK